MLSFSDFFVFLNIAEDFLWIFAAPVLLLIGITLTIQSRFFQIRKLPTVFRLFCSFLRVREQGERGIHPLKVFFASVGGCVGIGNIVGVCTAIQIGGPGALFWLWVTSLLGMIVKYSEVYLGLRYRIPNEQGSYNGGPMYFLRHVFKTPAVPNLIAILLCIYGVEVYQFSTVTESIVTNWNINPYIVIFSLLGLVLFATSGGLRRVGNISSAIIPLFVFLYIGMGLWVLINNLSMIPSVLGQVFLSAFSSSAAIGGFAGSILVTTITQGVRRGCYTGDLGVGYASIIHSESSARIPEEQASLAICDIFLDTFIICTTSLFLILVTEAWHQPINSSMMVQMALSHYFPYMEFFMPFFLLLLGYSTINAYFCVGLKCADYLHPRYGKKIFYLYAILALPLFSFIGTDEAMTLMAIINGLLLLINCYGIFRMRHQLSFALEPASQQQPVELKADSLTM